MPQLNLGEKITVKGPNGNIVAIVVGVGFDKAELEKLIASGELQLVESKKPEPKPELPKPAPVKKATAKKTGTPSA